MRGTYIATKPKNIKRLYGIVTKTVESLLPCDGTFIYVCEDAAIANQVRAFGKFKYYAGSDIDRYGVYCPNVKCDLDTCPAYKKIRELVLSGRLDGRKLDPNAITVDVETDPSNGEVVVTRVCNGDGRCGPISADNCDSLEDWWFDLETVAKSCIYCRNHTDNDADQGNVIRCNVSADGVADGAELVECDAEKLVHGGIIAFFKRLIGRRK